VIIAGVKPGEDREAALLHLSATFKQPVERLRALVASSHAVVKRGADLALASKMSAAIEAAGFDCVIEPEPAEPTVMTSPPPAARTASSPPPARP